MSSGTAAAAAAQAPPVQTVGRYQVRARIAAGGMASVFLGVATGAGGFERLVAIKMCHPHLRDDEDFARMFMEEARLAAQIHHPNVVATLDVGEAEVLYLVMEYIEGERLSDVVRASTRESGGPLPPAVTLRVMLDALAGLHAAHELHDKHGVSLGLIHRDVSPQNILVGLDGVARLTDFGIAKAAGASVVTATGQVKGKLSYMAPEQFVGRQITRRVDVFAAGVVLWESLTGKRLFAGENDAATTHRVLHLPVAPPSSVSRAIPPALDAVVLKALARDPRERFATAQEFADAIESCGVPAAGTRAVATTIDTLVGERVRERRGRLAAAPADATVAAPHAAGPADVPSNVSTVAPDLAVLIESGVHPAPTLTSAPTLASAPARARRKPRWLVLAAAASLASIVAGAFAYGLRERPRTTATPAVPPAAASTAPAPPLEPAAPAAPAALGDAIDGGNADPAPSATAVNPVRSNGPRVNRPRGPRRGGASSAPSGGEWIPPGQ